jgi:8-amino-7-oxononanoate synthase
LLDDCAHELSELDRQDLRRRAVAIDRIDGPVVTVEGRRLVNWCSNDYLGLSTHPRLVAAAAEAAAAFGVGARASRLLAGTTRHHRELEAALAAWFRQAAAVVFPSGYQANLGALTALLNDQDVIVADRMCHASLIDAARASGARLRVFRHNDAGHAAALLARAGAARRRLIATEGVFSMEGDAAPMADLAEAARRHDALVYVDDAHGAFVRDLAGQGEDFLYMGTLGKALGCQGGFLAGPEPVIELVRNRAKTFIYTTAPAAPVVAAAREALKVLAGQPELRQRLQANVRLLHERLAGSGPDRSPSHIVPVVVGTSEAALRMSSRLWDQGIWAPAIRPPTVPRGSARLRLSVTAAHSAQHIVDLARAVREARRA